MRRQVCLTLVYSMLFTPAISFATDPAPIPIAEDAEKLQLKQVELTKQGELIGQYLNQVGQPVANAEISVVVGKVTRKVVTDEMGRFSVSGLKGGRCIIQTGEEHYACQAWVFGTAPPSAIETVAIVKSDASVARGQFGGLNRFGGMGGGMRNRLASLSTTQKVGLGILVAGGTAIAIAVAQDDDDSAPAASF